MGAFGISAGFFIELGKDRVHRGAIGAYAG